MMVMKQGKGDRRREVLTGDEICNRRRRLKGRKRIRWVRLDKFLSLEIEDEGVWV